MNDNLRLKDLPQELKMNALFCGWRLTENGKVPFDLVTDNLARSNDPSTFVTYPTLLHYCHKYLIDDKKVSGIGLGIFRGYSAVDIDHCVDDNGELSEMAQDIVKYCDSYTEYSPSGKGIRIIFKTNTNLDKDVYYIKNSNLGLEIYISDNTNKFVTLTGNKISGDNVKEIDIKPILDKYMKRPNPVSVSQEVVEMKYSGNVDLERIVEKDSKFRELWYKTAPGSGSNESELDLSLCNKLAFYYKGDATRINDAFMSSPYFRSKDAKHKEKWFKDYGTNTIRMAIQFTANSINNQPLVKEETSIIPQPKVNYGLNDTGNSQRFVDRFGSDIKYNVENEKWMIWNLKYWETDVKDKIRDFVNVLAEEMRTEAFNIKDAMTQVRTFKNIDYIYNNAGKNNLLKESQHVGDIPVLNSELDVDPYLVCCDNGTYNLKTGQMQPFKKSDLISQTMGGEVSFEEPKRFVKFLEEMFSKNKEPDKMVRYIQKALGYSTSNSTREQCMWILHSDGNSGKSILLDIIGEALGTYSITSRPQLLTDQPNGNSNLEEIARLKGKRFIACEEIKMGDKLNESLIKSLTSGVGNQVARFLYGNSFEFAVTGKIWMATNYEPQVKGTDRGIWRRIKLIKIFSDFTGKEDKELKFKLREELPQIRGWLLKGFALYQEEGLIEPDEMRTFISDYKTDNDVVQRWIDDYCDVGEDYFETSTNLFENFNIYCLKYNYSKWNQTNFGKTMGKKNFDKKLYNGKTVYFGIRIKKDFEDVSRKAAFDNIKVNKDI